MTAEPPLRVCRIVTVPLTAAMLLKEQLAHILRSGIDLTLVCAPGPELAEVQRAVPVRCRTIPMRRRPDPLADLGSLRRLLGFLRRERFDILHSSTPKAGFLAALAGKIAGVPVRIHTYTGQPWVELRGLTRWIARQCDRCIARLDTHTYADSASQREFLIEQGIVPASKISVIGDGSIAGVDCARYDPSALAARRPLVRAELGIPPDALAIVFVGRVTADKGIVELLEAFEALPGTGQEVFLVLVGPLEPEVDPLPPALLERIASHPRIRTVGFVADTEQYLAAADVFCLPSYREGFGSVVIEAGAMELPTVATRVTGLVDAVVEGETGLLVPAKDAGALAAALWRLLEEPELRRRMGRAARQRALSRFEASRVNEATVREYYRLRPRPPARAG